MTTLGHPGGPLLDPGARMRVVTFVVSTFGSLGAQAQTLIKDIGRRTNLFVPFPLAHETSWATSSITTFLRSALTFQVRKRVAVILREHLPDDLFSSLLLVLLSKLKLP